MLKPRWCLNPGLYGTFDTFSLLLRILFILNIPPRTNSHVSRVAVGVLKVSKVVDVCRQKLKSYKWMYGDRQPIKELSVVGVVGGVGVYHK